MIRHTVIVLFSLALGACGGDEVAEPAVDRETVFDPLVDTLDRAEAVEDLALEQKNRLDDALQRMEGGEEKDE